MLKELKALWRDGTIMSDAVRTLARMVADASYVYGHAWEVCTGQAVKDAIAREIREHDKAVNRGEREVRRMLVEHLSINPGKDASGCLAVMIMAKDVERIGDHARNIFGVGMRLDSPITDYRLFGQLDRIQKAVGKHLPKLERAILDSDEAAVDEILTNYQEIKKQVKDAQSSLFEGEMESREAVNSTLLTRFLMRINAHVGNAASGVVFPLENIDFVSRGLRKKEEAR
ncbi:PhoU domain-containing protein [Verrucomicrobiota bacterium]